MYVCLFFLFLLLWCKQTLFWQSKYFYYDVIMMRTVITPGQWTERKWIRAQQWCRFFTSQSCVVNPLFDLGPVHQHSKGVSEEQLARARLEAPPVILYDRNTVLRSTSRHITVRQLTGHATLSLPSSHRREKEWSIPPALCHCRGFGPLWDWSAHVLCKATGKPL